MQAPVMVLNKNAQREQGKQAQAANIKAAKAVSDIVRTTLGPKSMLKMLLDPMGGIVLTNDGNAILREVSKRTFKRQIPSTTEYTLICQLLESPKLRLPYHRFKSKFLDQLTLQARNLCCNGRLSGSEDMDGALSNTHIINF